MKQKHVVVLGGGFAGLEALRAIRRHAPEAAVTLIDANPYATMVPALPDVVSGRIPESSLARPLSEIVEREVELLVDQIESVDLVTRKLLGTKSSYGYDYLVIANGSKPNFFGFQPEGGRLHSVHSYPTAIEFRDAFVEQARKTAEPEVIVVGAGYTGLEVATSLRYGTEGTGIRPRIRVVELAEDVVPFIREKTRTKIRAYLDAREIALLTSTSLQGLQGETVILSNGERIENALVCWSAGMKASQEKIEGDVQRTKDLRIKTNESLQLHSHPEVFVAGDAAALEKGGDILRRAVNFSIYSGRQAGKNVAALIRGGVPAPFRPADLGWVIPLSEISTGSILGTIPVGGSFGLRLHYFMCGFRHFGAGEAWEFYKTALRLRRSPGRMEFS